MYLGKLRWAFFVQLNSSSKDFMLDSIFTRRESSSYELIVMAFVASRLSGLYPISNQFEVKLFTISVSYQRNDSNKQSKGRKWKAELDTRARKASVFAGRTRAIDLNSFQRLHRFYNWQSLERSGILEAHDMMLVDSIQYIFHFYFIVKLGHSKSLSDQRFFFWKNACINIFFRESIGAKNAASHIIIYQQEVAFHSAWSQAGKTWSLVSFGSLELKLKASCEETISVSYRSTRWCTRKHVRSREREFIAIIHVWKIVALCALTLAENTLML